MLQWYCATFLLPLTKGGSEKQISMEQKGILGILERRQYRWQLFKKFLNFPALPPPSFPRSMQKIDWLRRPFHQLVTRCLQNRRSFRTVCEKVRQKISSCKLPQTANIQSISWHWWKYLLLKISQTTDDWLCSDENWYFWRYRHNSC